MDNLPIFPGLAWPMTRSNLGFGLTSQESLSGVRVRSARRSIPRYRWSLSYEFLRSVGQLDSYYRATSPVAPFSDKSTFSDKSKFASDLQSDLQKMLGFWNSTLGGVHSFLYQERSDCAVIDQVFGVGDGVTTVFQLVRTLGKFTEPVYGPDSSIRVFAGSSEVTSQIHILSGGRILFSSPPQDGVTLRWAGAYRWVCRFDDDQLDFETFSNGLWSLKKMTFSSEILP